MNYFGIEREAKERQEGLLREAQGRRLVLEARSAGTEQTSEEGANTVVQVTGTRLSRIGGLLVFVGAVVFVLHVVLRSVLTAGVDPLVWAQADLWVPLNALGALGAALVLLGMPAIYARIAPQGGLPGLVGFALIGVSWTFFGLILSLYGALVLPWLAEQAPRLFTGSSPTPLGFVVAFALGLLAWLVGAALLAVPFVRGRARPRWVGYLLPPSALWVLVGSFVLAPGGPASNLAVNLLSNLGPVLLLIGLGYLGFRAWTERARPGTSGRMPVANRAEKGPPSLGVSPGGCGKGSMRSRKHATFRGSKMGLQRWFYDGGRPNWMARLLDRGTAALSARGVGPGYLVALEVPGRRSGCIVGLPLVVASVGSERYLLSMLGEGANWVRNVRAAGGEVALRHGRREEVRLEEIAVDRRAPVLKAHLQRAPNAGAHVPVHKDAPLTDFERVAPRFPVFWVTPSHAASPASSEVDDEVREPVQ